MLRLIVEWYEPTHDKWYKADAFNSWAMANARKRELIRVMKREGIIKPQVRITSKA